MPQKHAAYLPKPEFICSCETADNQMTESTPTHQLAKEMRARVIKAQTYHRWSGQNDWTTARKGQTYHYLG